MRRRSNLFTAAQRTLLLAACLLSAACHTKSSTSTPAITFEKVPIAHLGGPDVLDTISGRATDVQAGQQIVLYAKSRELWWIQPFSEHPYTKVQADSRWSNQIHLGTEYAALLINRGYKPPGTTENLPVLGGGVAAMAITPGRGKESEPDPIKTLHFGGYDWTVHNGGAFRGGHYVSFVSENAWTDDKGALHLRINRGTPDWGCAEVKLTRSLGYGTYRFRVRDISQVEPSAVVSLFTWDGVGTEESRHELDIELARWGFPDNDNAQYVVQPYYIPANIVRFRVPTGALVHSIQWKPGQAVFTTAAESGNPAKQRVIHEHVFTAGVPVAGGDAARINFYVFVKGQTPLKNDAEIVIDKFEYLP
jgi:hypothetical protein